MKLWRVMLCVFGFFVLSAGLSPPVHAASVSVTGKAKVVNTDNSYLDFTGNKNSNVVIDNITGVFSGYAFSEDVGWVAFGTTDNAQGPVSVNLTTGVVSGKAKVLLTEKFLDFSNYNSNVIANISTGVFSGYVFSNDIGWLNFSDTGVTTNNVTLDSVAPNGFALDSPGGGTYTNSERPIFRWRTTTDEIGSIAQYILEIDNGESDDFSITSIPAERTEDYVTSKYTAHYDGFSDTDANNNYISVYTHSSSEWAANNNDGKLKEGKRSWKVKAKDSNGNEKVESRDLFADFTVPSATVTQVNDAVGNSSFSTTDITPTIFGEITDTLSGDSSTTKVAGGPKSVEVKLEKKDAFGGYILHSLANLNISDVYWTSDNQKIADNTQQTSDKYSVFSFTPSEALNGGSYRITITGKDVAGNTSGSTSINLDINTSLKIPFLSQPKEKRTEVIPIEPEKSIEEKEEPTPPPLSQAQKEMTQTSGPNFIARVFDLFKRPFFWIGKAANTAFAYLTDTVGKALAFAGNTFASGARTAGRLFAYTKGVVKASSLAIASTFKQPRQIAGNVKQWLAYSAGSFSEIVLDKEPTRITDVKIVEVGSNYAIIEWQTNHFTKNNKVNWGEDMSYGKYAFAEDFTKVHHARLEELKPGTKYVFEVMSQNKNYIYDSFHEFVTKPE